MIDKTELFDDYNWEKAFECAGLAQDAVETIEGKRDGDNDGPSWFAFGTLTTGQWFVLSAWCDYTGWG